jgi:hypothetical protein
MSYFDLVPLLIFTFLCVFFFLSETSVLRFQDFYCKKKSVTIGHLSGLCPLVQLSHNDNGAFLRTVCVCADTR